MKIKMEFISEDGHTFEDIMECIKHELSTTKSMDQYPNGFAMYDPSGERLPETKESYNNANTMIIVDADRANEYFDTHDINFPIIYQGHVGIYALVYDPYDKEEYWDLLTLNGKFSCFEDIINIILNIINTILSDTQYPIVK